MEVLIAIGLIVLGWGLGVGTQIWRDRRQARIALMLIHNELLGSIAQLDLAMTGARMRSPYDRLSGSSDGSSLAQHGSSRERSRCSVSTVMMLGRFTARTTPSMPPSSFSMKHAKG
jgi:hypothetical protein